MITSWASSTMQILDQIGWMGAFPKQVKYDFSSNVTTLTLGLWHVSSVCRPSVGLWHWKCTVQLFVNILQQQQYLGTIGGLCLFGKEIQGYWSCKEGRMYGMNKKLSCRTMLRVIEYFDKSLKSRSLEMTPWTGYVTSVLVFRCNCRTVSRSNIHLLLICGRKSNAIILGFYASDFLPKKEILTHFQENEDHF